MIAYPPFDIFPDCINSLQQVSTKVGDTGSRMVKSNSRIISICQDASFGIMAGQEVAKPKSFPFGPCLVGVSSKTMNSDNASILIRPD